MGKLTHDGGWRRRLQGVTPRSKSHLKFAQLRGLALRAVDALARISAQIKERFAPVFLPDIFPVFQPDGPRLSASIALRGDLMPKQSPGSSLRQLFERQDRHAVEYTGQW